MAGGDDGREVQDGAHAFAPSEDPSPTLDGAALVGERGEAYEGRDAFAVELQSGELPSAAFAACARPVLVVRRGADGADVAAARVAADALQAELAPGFDFAGYFVETR